MKIPGLTDTGEWTTRRYLSLLGNVLIWVVVAIDAWYLWPVQLGGSTSMVIVSGVSMEPTYFSGDLVIARKVDPSVGDVIVYAPAGLGGGQIVHRIIGGNATDGWQMQGDNNDFVDPYTPKASEVRGVVLVHYANFGRVTALLLNPMVWAAVLLLALVLLVWWSGDSCEDDPDDDDDDADAGAGGDRVEEDTAPIDEAVLEVAMVEASVVDPTAVAPAGVGPTVVDPAVVDPAVVDPAVVDPAVVDPAVVDPAVVDPTAPKPGVVRGFAALAAALFAVALTVSPASASQLQVNVAGTVATMDYARCSDQTLTSTVSGTSASGSYTAVSVTGFAAACQGIAATVYLYSASGAQLATGTATPSAATATFATGSYVGANVSTVVVKVAGWPFIAPWTPPVVGPFTCVELTAWPGNAWEAPSTYGVPTGNTCTVTYTYFDAWGGTPPKHFNLYFTVSGVSTGNWRVTIDFSDPYFQGLVPTNLSGNGNPLKAQGYECSQLPVFVGQANLGWAASNRNNGYLSGSAVGNSGGLCSR